MFSNEIITNLKVMKSLKMKNLIKFNDLRKFEEKNYISFRGSFLIKEKFTDKLQPELEFIINQI